MSLMKGRKDMKQVKTTPQPRPWTDPEFHGDEVGVGVHAVHPVVEAVHHVTVVVQRQDGHVCKGVKRQ